MTAINSGRVWRGASWIVNLWVGAIIATLIAGWLYRE